jgi:hypothetical protein
MMVVIAVAFWESSLMPPVADCFLPSHRSYCEREKKVKKNDDAPCRHSSFALQFSI